MALVAMLLAGCGTQVRLPACTPPANPVRRSGQVRVGASMRLSDPVAGVLTEAADKVVDPGGRRIAGNAGTLAR